ncbi:uncharacterized protein LOC128310878 [Anopheles moucheti]|uniref:uncharacterized protein LOC128310878 n=1 Tax=Anopheles moucheti TaxID=186751 RepID=UPI0022F06332|nr:uncharacterized protein LOC128310878 [Anopheles moucheti]
MRTEAILIALTGLISVVVTSTLVGKQPASLLQPTATLAKSDSLNISQTVQETRFQRMQSYCSSSITDAGCFAYKKMMEVASRYKVTEIEHIIEQELSHNLSEPEDDEFCSDLSKTVKRLPASLFSRSLEPFKRTPSCVGLCYTIENVLADVCRALFSGYKLLLQSVGKEENKHQPMEALAGNKPDSLTNRSDFAKIVPAMVEIKKPTTEEIKDKVPFPIINNTRTTIKKDNTDKNANAAVTLAPSSRDISQANKPKSDVKPVAVGEPVSGAKIHEKAPNAAEHIPEQSQDAALPDKNEGNMDQQQGEIDDAGGDMAPFDEEPKQTGNQDAKSATQAGYDNSDESDGIASAEDVNENGDDLELSGIQPVGKQPAAPEKAKQDEFAESSKASDIVSGSDPFYDQKDSNFFSYFLFAMFSCAMLYVAYHNKSKLLALVVEGRRTSSGRGGFSKGRKHTAAYRKLDSNLEEAITSGSGTGGHSSSQIIY